MNSMKDIEVGKVVLNISVGKGGRELTNAENILEEVSGKEPVRTHAKQTHPSFEVREGAPIGCKVTLRDESAIEILEKLLEVKGDKLDGSCFDDNGNFSFGIEEHIEIPDMEYNPDVGIFGMNVTVNLVRPGFRVKKRRRQPGEISSSHHIDREEAIEFLEREFNTEVE